MTEEDLAKIERLTRDVTGEWHSCSVDDLVRSARLLIAEVRRLQSIETAAEKYRAKLLTMLEASAEALDEHDTDAHEAHWDAISAAVWDEDGKALHRLLSVKAEAPAGTAKEPG